LARVLAIHAHPDDVEILAGGTLALLAARGHHITIATMTAGDCGSREWGPRKTAAIRRREAANSAALIDAGYVCAGLYDCAVFSDDASRRRVTEVLRQARAELVLAASPVDYMCDHEAASALVRDACFAAPAPNYATRARNKAPALDAIPHLYFMDPVEGRDREGGVVRPDFIVDVSSTFERKWAMLAEHRSQKAWLLQHHGIDDYLEAMRRWTGQRGALAGLSHGEGFRQYRGHGYPRTPLLEQLLGAGTVIRCDG
jgi:N-acetylglucosamine malate deacetylase 1